MTKKYKVVLTAEAADELHKVVDLSVEKLVSDEKTGPPIANVPRSNWPGAFKHGRPDRFSIRPSV